MPEGPGIVSGAGDWLHILPWAVAIAFAVIAAYALVRRERRRNLALAILAGLFAVLFIGLARHASPVTGDFMSAPVGVADGYYITAAAGGPFVVSISVTNPGVLPVRILGVVGPSLVPSFPGWSSVSVAAVDERVAPAPLSSATPFVPFDLAPGESVQLNVTGTAHACATASASDSTVSVDALPLAYSVLGLEAVTDLEFIEPVEQRIKQDCASL